MNYIYAIAITFWSLSIYGGARPTSAPFISGDTFRSFATFIFDETTQFDPLLVKQGDVIFVAPDEPLDGKKDFLRQFFERIHPHIQHQYILITHNSDKSAPGVWKEYLQDRKIYAWFAENCDMQHQKLIPIPIGLENAHWGRLYPERINSVKSQAIQKRILLYGNFNIKTNPSLRAPVYQYFKKKPFCYFSNKKPLDHYLIDIACSKFVLCPQGNGMDTHRIWESIILGSIPVIQHSVLDPLYEELPVVLIHHWNEITPAFLEEKYREIDIQKYNNDKLYETYWHNTIKVMQQHCREAIF